MSKEPTPLSSLAPPRCMCGMGNDCVCPATERALRYLTGEPNDAVLTDKQRAWCLQEIGSVEGYDVEDYKNVITPDLARGVLDAWRDFCRDKGLL